MALKIQVFSWHPSKSLWIQYQKNRNTFILTK